MAFSTRAGFELERITVAPCSSAASATANPMPDVPPKMRTRWPASLCKYLNCKGDIVPTEPMNLSNESSVLTNQFDDFTMLLR